MKILYVVSRPLEINTSASIRSRAIIDGLLELGHEVDLITTQPDKNHTHYDNSILNKRIHTLYLELRGVQRLAKIGRKYKYIKSLRKFVYNLMSRYNIYDNLSGITRYASKLNIDDDMYDLIISSSDPKSSHLFVSKMIERGLIRNTPWIQIWGDPFLSDITRRNRILDPIIKKEENKLISRATKVVYVSKLTLEEQKKLYHKHVEKMFYSPIPYVKKEIYPIDSLPEESLTFLYCGDYYSNVRNIKPLYEAIKNSENKLIICGNTNIKLESTERIKIYPRVNFEKTKEFESSCDVLVHLSNLTGTQIPGKIYQYSGTNKLILFILDGQQENLQEIFGGYKRYIFCKNNTKDISETLLQIKNGIFNDTRFIVEEFSPKNIAKEIIKLI